MAEDNRAFATQLNKLFTRPIRINTNTMVAQILTDRGFSISAAYLSQLRTGVRTQPSDQYVRAIAEYFGVPLSYFYDAPFESVTDMASNRDPELIDAIDDNSVRRLLRTAYGLSPDSIDILVTFVDRLRIIA